jgi:NADH-quinone oxidoreductase subunit L
MPENQYAFAWLIPLFPLLGFLFCGFFGRKFPKNVVGGVATAAVFASFVVALIIFFMVRNDPGPHFAYLAPWFAVPGYGGVAPLQVNFELLIDPLTSLMLLIITGVGGLIHLYSTGYMAEEEGYPRFFTYLNLFIFFMLLLVMGNNFVLMFVGWEGVGLCSYLLIGYYTERKSAADAAKKAFIVNRIGDVGVLIGMFLAFQYFHTLDFYSGHAFDTSGVQGILDRAPQLGPLIAATPFLAAIISTIGIMIFWGCTGKSAQLPLYVWLPDAMEGPTPVSALIHAATMVTAGVYLISRIHALAELSTLTMAVIAWIGIITAIFAASIGLVQNDIKRVLAYSTVSQLGYMFAACGVGAFTAGMFHVLTHAFFKACLFLGSGAIIHAMDHAIHERGGHPHPRAVQDITIEPANPDDPQDMRNMGGLRTKLPTTHWTMLVSTFAIAGIPLFSGWFSKDEILYKSALVSWGIWAVGAVTAAMTAFYMMRLMYKTFYGPAKTHDAEHTHEATPSMTTPLIILGILAIFGGWIGMPAAFHVPNLLENFLNPATGNAIKPAVNNNVNEVLLLIVSSVVAVLFVYISYSTYKAKQGGQLVAEENRATAFPYWLVFKKYLVDVVYEFFFVRLGQKLADFLWKDFDNKVVDGAVNGVGWLAAATGRLFRSWQTGYVRNYAFSMLIGVLVVVLICLASFQYMIH